MFIYLFRALCANLQGVNIVTLCRWPDGHLQSVTIPDAVEYNLTS